MDCLAVDFENMYIYIYFGDKCAELSYDIINLTSRSTNNDILMSTRDHFISEFARGPQASLESLLGGPRPPWRVC